MLSLHIYLSKLVCRLFVAQLINIYICTKAWYIQNLKHLLDNTRHIFAQRCVRSKKMCDFHWILYLKLSSFINICSPLKVHHWTGQEHHFPTDRRFPSVVCHSLGHEKSGSPLWECASAQAGIHSQLWQTCHCRRGSQQYLQCPWSGGTCLFPQGTRCFIVVFIF